MITANSLVTIIAVAISSVGPIWLTLTLLAIGAGAVAVIVNRRRDLLALEVHMGRALIRSCRWCPVHIVVPNLSANVRAEAMTNGVIQIETESWLDGIRALGFLMGRDRGFQIDRLRRMAAGRLSEILGRTTLSVDTYYRSRGFADAAKRAMNCLEREETDLLEAFASGVTAAWDHGGPPWECRFLSYKPEPWTPSDSLLITLLLFHSLSWTEESKRAEAIIRRVLPDHIARFFLPANDSADPSLPKDLADFRVSADAVADFITTASVIAGSNCWVKRDPNGPVLACDLHMPLGMPNLLYEIDLRWSNKRLRGLMVAGLPVVLTGSNDHLAWGVTNLNAGVLDLVPVHFKDGEPPVQTTRSERIRVRGDVDTILNVAYIDGAPVSARSLHDENVAFRWTGYDERACDLKFQRLAQTTSVDESIALLDRAQGIPLNVIVADESGRMAHLATGLLPRRNEVSGEYLAPRDRPRLIGSPSGTLVSANDAAPAEHSVQMITYDADPGHRARRIRLMLDELKHVDAISMRAMQHDTRSDLHLQYRDLVLPALQGRQDSIATLLAEWNGNASVESIAFTVLTRLREVIVKRVLSSYLSVCHEHDPHFRYAFRMIDRPVLAILASRELALLPPDAETDDWDGFINRCVDTVVNELKGFSKGCGLPKWGEINQIALRHPLQDLVPWAGALLGIEARQQPGALECVRTCVPGFSAVGRAILKPGLDGTAEFEIPGGQSSHPLSRHYDDRHDEWASTTSRRAPRTSRCRCMLRAAKLDEQKGLVGERRDVTAISG